MRVPSASLALVLMSTSLFAAHTPRPIAPQEVFVPFWSVQPGWHTELMIRNNNPRAMTVVPALRSRTGAETALEPVELAANDSQTISVAEVLSRVAPRILSEPDAFGSLVFRYSARSVGNIYASVLVGRVGSPIEFHFDAAESISDPTSASYQSIWWRATNNSTDTLVLANLFDQPLQGTLRIFDAKGHSAAHPFALAARETQQISITELLAKYEISGEFGGLAVEPGPSRLLAGHAIHHG